MNPKPLEIICFHCQQSAEKDLKVFLVKDEQIVKKISKCKNGVDRNRDGQKGLY